MHVIKRTAAAFFTLLLLLSLAACTSSAEKTVFDRIRESPAAKLELPDGRAAYADGEIASLRSLADMDLAEFVPERAPDENGWLYRIVFNPAERVKNAGEIAVSFYEDCVKIGPAYYRPGESAAMDGVLEWAQSKFDALMR